MKSRGYPDVIVIAESVGAITYTNMNDYWVIER